MLRPEDSRDLMKSYKRLAWFILCIVLFDAFIAYLLYRYTKISGVLCGFIIICITTLVYLLFLAICAKIDKKKKEKLEKSGKKDPFSHN